MGGQCTGRWNTKWGRNQGQRPALATPPAEPTPRGASSPASLLACLDHTPMRAAAAGHDPSVIQGRKWRTAGPVRLPPLISSRGEAPPPRDPSAGDLAGKRPTQVRGRGPSLAQSIPEPPASSEPTNLKRGGVVRPADAAAPSATGRSSVVSPAAGGNLTAAGDGITRPRTAPTKPLLC